MVLANENMHINDKYRDEKYNILKFGKISNIPWDWEIINSFMYKYSIKATWINCNYTWGSYDEATGSEWKSF